MQGVAYLIDLIKDKQVLVVGMARSGMAAVDLLLRYGASKVIVTDRKDASLLKDELELLSRCPMVKVVTGGNPEELVTDKISLVIKSPGIPPSLELFKRARKDNIPVISEIELAYTFARAPIIGVTGSNGKTTTTALIATMLKKAGFEPVEAAGNIGKPLSSVVNKVSAQGIIVAELSSFQLEDIIHFRPMVSVFLNFAEDHLDYHGDTGSYLNAKKRIFENQLKSDMAVINSCDPVVSSLASAIKGKIISFGYSPVTCGVVLDKDVLTLFKPGFIPREICRCEDIALPGQHNLENAMAAAAAAWAAGADIKAISDALKSFKSIEHRLEYVALIKGVEYINDSKGTNPGSTIKALKAYPDKGKILIAGGKDKGSDFTELSIVIRDEVRKVFLIGETSCKMASVLKKIGYNNVTIVKKLEEAVQYASREAVKGEIIMLSPACASWDMFTDYEERGNLFKKLVIAQSNQDFQGGSSN